VRLCYSSCCGRDALRQRCNSVARRVMATMSSPKSPEDGAVFADGFFSIVGYSEIIWNRQPANRLVPETIFFWIR
jgi:hypothetical protein